MTKLNNNQDGTNTPFGGGKLKDMNAKELEEQSLIKLGFTKMIDGHFKRGNRFIKKNAPIWYKDKMKEPGDKNWTWTDIGEVFKF